MNNSIMLIERVRLTTPNQSKEQTAAALHMPTSTLRGIYNEKRYPNAMHCTLIAEITRIDLAHVLAYVAADKARSEETRASVSNKLPRLHPAAAVAIAALAGFIGSTDANAKELEKALYLRSLESAQVMQMDSVYIMRKKLRKTWGNAGALV
jgi:hypothetical protein